MFQLCKFLFTASGFDTSRITCYAGETITILFERISRDSLNDFTGYRVCKNDSMFGSLEKDSGSVYNCSDNYADLEPFCLKKTEFEEFFASHILKIKNIRPEELCERRAGESLNDFSGYRVCKNDSMFGSLEKNPGFVSSRITCFCWKRKTIPLERILRGSLNDFSGYLVCKNDLMFGSLEKDPGSVYNCSYYYADWEQFCLLKTEFEKCNASYMMSKIKNITAGDSGNYSVYFVFNNFESHDIKETQLEVIEGK